MEVDAKVAVHIRVSADVQVVYPDHIGSSTF
jgi:hypothetical protein